MPRSPFLAVQGFDSLMSLTQQGLVLLRAGGGAFDGQLATGTVGRIGPTEVHRVGGMHTYVTGFETNLYLGVA